MCLCSCTFQPALVPLLLASKALPFPLSGHSPHLTLRNAAPFFSSSLGPEGSFLDFWSFQIFRSNMWLSVMSPSFLRMEPHEHKGCLSAPGSAPCRISPEQQQRQFPSPTKQVPASTSHHAAHWATEGTEKKRRFLPPDRATSMSYIQLQLPTPGLGVLQHCLILLPTHCEELVTPPNGLEVHFQKFTAISLEISRPCYTTVVMNSIKCFLPGSNFQDKL